MGDAAGGFIGGFTKSFAKGMLEKRAKEHAQDLENEAKQYKVMQDALHVATQRGDTPAIAHIIRSMEEFSTVGNTTKGKKKKEAQGGILSKFADLMEGGQPTDEAKLATQNNQALIDSGRPEEATRPRFATTKPLLMSNRDLAQQETEQKVTEQQAMLPGEVEKYKAQQTIMGNRIKAQRAEDAVNSVNAAMTKMDAKEQIDGRKRLNELKNATKGDEGAAAELYLQEINAGIHQKESSANLSDTRASYIPKDYQLHKEQADRLSKHYDELEARAREASTRGDNKLSNVLTQKNYKGIQSSMNAAVRQMGFIESEINNKSRIATNTLTPPADREQAKRELADMDKQYTDLREEVRGYQQQLKELDQYGSGESTGGKSFSNPSTSPSSTPQGKKRFGIKAFDKDESGYVKNQTISSEQLMKDHPQYAGKLKPGSKYTYTGIDSDGNMVFKVAR